MNLQLFILGLLLGMPFVALAEQGAIGGAIQTINGQALFYADIQIQSENTGARWRTQSDDAGGYIVRDLPGGLYKVTVRMPGFRTVSRVGVIVDSAEVSLDFAMEILSVHTTISVVTGQDKLDPSNGDTLILTRDSPGATLPVNGPDVRASFDLMPGVVVTPASISDAGRFTSNGQRPNSSSFRLDGVSANTGVGGSALPGSFPGASLPAMTAFGSAENHYSGTMAATSTEAVASDRRFTGEALKPSFESHSLVRHSSLGCGLLCRNHCNRVHGTSSGVCARRPTTI